MGLLVDELLRPDSDKTFADVSLAAVLLEARLW